MANLTLEQLIERKRQSEDSKVKYKAIHSELLGGLLLVKKIPLRQVTELLDRYPDPNTTESMEMFQELIYRSCELLRSKELVSDIEGDKYEVVGQIFDDNVDEITRVGGEILDFYFSNGLPTVAELKNS